MNTNLTSEQKLEIALKKVAELEAILDKIEETHEAELEAAKEETKNEMLNELSKNKLFDKVEQQQTKFRQMRKNGETMAENIKICSDITNSLYQFLRNNNIVSFGKPVGEIFSVNCLEVEGNYNYYGTPFRGDEDIKEIEVMSLGWKNKKDDTIISLQMIGELNF